MNKPHINLLALLVMLVIVFIVTVNLNICYATVYPENKTGVTINKQIQGDILHKNLIYDIKTPKVNDFDFVLAVDSSGSTGPDENNLEGPAIAAAVPAFIEEVANNYSMLKKANFNISVVSWNDNIDFASYDFKNTDPARAHLISINKSINDIDVFVNEFKRYYNYSDETRGTNISTAIKTSYDILNYDSKPNIDYHKTKKFVLLVVGKGEYKPCNQALMKVVRGDNKAVQGNEIFTIGLDIPESSSLFKHLKDLALNRDGHWRFIGADPGALQGSLNRNLETALMEALDNATNSAVAHNVRIVESLYCYYTPDLGSFTINGVSVNKNSVQLMPNADGTTTIILPLPEPEGLKPNSHTIVSFAANFNPTYLPVTFTGNRESINLCTPSAATLPFLHYDWFNGEPFDVHLI